ncbi:MAG: hypothetical protein LQ352_005986 [Teloschistes flavicans]|nr:MAG: hypothetical protein LQ352_005986 [Teloschistes flavicans]
MCYPATLYPRLHYKPSEVHYSLSRNWNPAVPGRCINELAFARYTAILNVSTGFLMLLLPLPMVWRLNVTVQQKVALTATFLHGIIGFAASVARLAILFESPQTRSFNWLAISWTIWTIVEPANYVIAACLPTLRPVLVKILPHSFFVLTFKRRSKPYSSPKRSWRRGRTMPQIAMASADIRGPSHITGPWDSSRTQPVDHQYTSRTQSESTLAV